MTISDVVRTLPANRLVFDVRRDLHLAERFSTDLEGLMEDYGLSEAERDALRSEDLKRLSELGVHPYFLTQISRLFHGSSRNSQKSAAAQSYARSLMGGDKDER